MRIIILGSASNWYARDLRRAAASDYEIANIPFSHLGSEVGNDGIHITANNFRTASKVCLNDFDATLVRTMPPGSLEQVVFRMDALFQLERSGHTVLNPPKSLEASIDKYVTTARLQEASLQVPRTVVCQTVDDAMNAFERIGNDVVVKPIFGGEGRGIIRVTDEEIALRVFSTLAQLNAAIYLQEFIHHDGSDIRLFVVGKTLFGMRRRNPSDWRTNASRGAVTERIEITDQLSEIARRSAAAVGAPIAGVDILEGPDGKMYVIEVNAVPGWRKLAATINIDIGRVILDFVASTVNS